MTDNKKPGIAFWVAVVLGALVLYVLSIGPACWISSRANAGGWYSPKYRAINRNLGID